MTNIRTATWTNIGTNVADCNNNIDNILAEAGLDYKVISRPAYTEVDGQKIELPNHHVVLRESDNHVYQVAKNSYNICQNRDAFSIVEEFGDDIKVVKAGECPNGMVYLIGEMPEIKVLDDAFKPHVILQNSHNADFALKSAIVPLRMVCQNQFNVAFREAGNSFTIKHTSTIGSRIANMNEMLKGATEYLTEFNRNAEQLAVKKVDFNKFVAQLFPDNTEMTERQLAKMEENRQTMLTAYNSTDNANFKGTAWGIMNAAMDYDTHRKSRGGDESKFINTVVFPTFARDVYNMLQAA